MMLVKCIALSGSVAPVLQEIEESWNSEMRLRPVITPDDAPYLPMYLVP
jgi:hypothetical protein